MRLACACFTSLLTLAVIGCSSGTEEGDGGGSGNDNGSGSGSDGDGIVFGSGNPNGGGGGGSDLSGGDFQACVAESVATETSPLDIYIMFDRSCSMSCPPELAGPGQCCLGDPRPRIDQVRSAVEQFLSSPDSAGIGVGIGYFGYFPTGETSCDPAAYSMADVGVGPLPEHAGNIVASLNSVDPVGETPTGAAIRGACNYAQGWKQQNPGHTVVILLVTDGVPEAPVSLQCNPTLEDAEAAAQECLNAVPSVPTYVLGVGANLDNLGRLAAAGGTGQAHLVGPNTDVTNEVLEALSNIRDSAAVPCDFQIPEPPSGEQLDPTLVNVTYRDTSGDENLVVSVGSEQGCGQDGGWFYNDPAAPTAVRLCPSTCNVVTANLLASSVTGRSASIDLRYGCGTVVVTR